MRREIALLGLLPGFLACASAEKEPPAREVTRYSVADFFANTSVFGASFSPDRSRILVSSNQSGVYNAYAIPVAGGAPEPLTSSGGDAIFAIAYFPNDDRILYSSDQGGNELAHVFVRNSDGSTKDLTPGSGHRAMFAGWAGDDRSFWVTTNERDQRFFDLYRYQVDGLGREMFYRNTEGFLNGLVSRDGGRIALEKSLGSNNSDVYVHDLSTGQTRNITAHEGVVANRPAAWSPDGSRLLILTDQGREFVALRAVDIATGAVTPVLEPQWDVVAAGYTESGKHLAVVVNEDARFVVRLHDAATLGEVTPARLPSGLVLSGMLEVSPDDSLVAFYGEKGAEPPNLYVAPFGGEPRRLTNTLNAKIAAEDLVEARIVRFGSYDGLQVPGILYRPHHASTDRPVPALVMVHGGPGGQAQLGYNPIVQSLVNAGYAVFDINNRGSSGYGKTFSAMDNKKHGEADLGDVVASKRMLDSLGWVDTTKVGIIGGSYGGYMTLAALTLAPGQFKVAVDLFGISNWVRTLSSIPPWWTAFRQSLYDELGDPATDSARLHRISPLFHAERINVPLMVLQGANDPRVLQQESDDIVEAARKNGVPVEYVVFPDEGHGFVKRGNEIKGYTAIIQFLDQHLKRSGDRPAQVDLEER